MYDHFKELSKSLPGFKNNNEYFDLDFYSGNKNKRHDRILSNGDQHNSYIYDNDDFN